MLRQLFILSARLSDLFTGLINHSRPSERLRAATGATLGLGCAVWMAHQFVGPEFAAALAGPLGASAILLFVVSSGALAQPWPLLGSYLFSALTGALLAQYFGHSLPIACVAVTLSLLVMFALRCLHPPGAAVALAVVLCGPALGEPGLMIVAPIMASAVCLLLSALVFNNLTGAAYPKRASSANHHHTSDAAPERRVGITDDDLDSALEEFGSFVDITKADLERIVRITERSALRRNMGDICAEQIMSRDVRSVSPDTTVLQALQLLRHHHVKTMPVVDAAGALVGIVSLGDLMGEIDKPEGPLFPARMKVWRGQPISKWMTSPVISVDAQTHVMDMIPLMSRHGLHSLPVMNRNQLVGLVTQTDLIAALHRDLLAHL
ncbi:MAG TPA: HPP family protein [Pseudomonas xinjiangensis]|uniref:HPP family protein n=2 Tax=root TaxID=1 RepID=A0A7V1BSK5_9GAMM|nr:HPP family protein [Halopseudomonas xinjiangensis]HEC46995.1 HPP family protein [Halopseudomonas xinjiangensis]